MSEKVWDKAFTQGSRAMQDRLKRVHAKNPKFQAWLASSGHGAGESVKQASKEIKPSERVKKLQAKSAQAYGATKGLRMGGEDGSGEALRDTVAPLTRDQHSKVQAAERAAKAAAKTAAPKKAKVKKPLSQAERIAAIAKAAAKAKSKSRFDVPTVDPDDVDHDDLIDVHQSLHVRKGYNEEMNIQEGKMKDIATDREETARLAAQEKEPPFTPDKKSVRRGPGGPMSQAKWLAKQAMMKKMKELQKEEVEIVEEPQSEADKGEYDYEGDMAKSQLKSIIMNAQRLHDMLSEETNLPEWVQSKITLAQDYVLTAASYMEGEMNEELVRQEEAIFEAMKKMESEMEDDENEEDDEEEMNEKYMGFAKLASTLKAKGARNPAAVAAAIGRKKYGKAKFQAAAASGKKMSEEAVAEAMDPVGQEDKDINNDKKVDKTDVYLHSKRKAIGDAIKKKTAEKMGKE